MSGPTEGANAVFTADVDISNVISAVDEVKRAFKMMAAAGLTPMNDLENALKSPLQRAERGFSHLADVIVDTLKKVQTPAAAAAKDIGKAVTDGVAKGVSGSADAVGKALSDGASAGVRRATPQVKRELAGYYNSMGLFISNETDRLTKATESANSRMLALGANTVRKATQDVKRDLGGHYDALGNFISTASQEAVKAAQSAHDRMFAVGTNSAARAAPEAKRAVAGYYDSLGRFVSAETSRLIARAEQDAARLEAALSRAGKLTAVPSSYRSLQSSGTTSTALWQAGLAAEASGIRQEMAKFYTQVQADAARLEAAWKRIGSPDTVSESFRSLQGTLRKETGAVSSILRNGADDIAVAQRQYYAELERVGNVKDAIRARLATGDVGVKSAKPVRMSLDQRDAQYAESMSAMKAYYSGLDGPDPKTAKAMLSDVLGLTAAKKDFKAAVDDASKSMASGSGTTRSFSKDLNGLHSAARGVASGFNAMWLTWGQLGPLLAGAALSNVFVQSIQKGKQFENTLTTIGALGEVAGDGLENISAAALEMGANSQYGPQQVVEGLKTMVLAGESAEKAIIGISAAMQFATVAELPMEQATEYLLAITKSFGFTTEEMNKVSDVVAKTAATTMSSVKDMADAFRVSSTVAQQFGASIEDQSVALGILSQIGIKGREAGTAVRNMYTELLGTTKEARAILKDTFKLELFKGDELRPLKDIMVDITKTIVEFEAKGQISLLDRVFNERGMKMASAYLKALQTEAQSAGVSVAELAKNASKLEQALRDSSGFSAVASAAMASSTENIMKSVGSSFDAALIKAFESVSPYLVKFSLELRKAIQSEEFVNGISDIVRGIGDLSKFLYENLDVIKALGVGYVTYKAVSLALVAPLTLTSMWAKNSAVALTEKAAAVTGAGLASQVAAAGFTRAATAVSALGVAARVATGLMGPIGLLLTAGMTLYTMFGDSAQSAADKAEEAAKRQVQKAQEIAEAEELRAGVTMEAMQKEIDRIDAFLASGGDEKKMQEDLAEKAVQTARSRIASENWAQAALKESEADELDLIAAMEQRRAIGSGGMGPYIAELKAQSAAARAEAAQLWKDAGDKLTAFDSMVAKLKEKREQEDAARAAKRQNRVGGGGKTFDPDSKTGREDRAKAFKLQLDNELQQVAQQYAIRLEMTKKLADDEQAVLKKLLDKRLVDAGAYAIAEQSIILKSEAEQLAIISADREKYAKAWASDIKDVQDQYAKFLQENKDKKGFAEAQATAAETLTTKLKDLGNTAKTQFERFQADEEKIKSSAIRRMTEQAIEARGALRELEIASEEFWRKEGLNKAKTKREDSLEDNLRYASPEAAAVMKAGAAEAERFNDLIADQSEKLRKSRQSLDSYRDGMQAAIAEQARLRDAGVQSEDQYKAAVNSILALEQLLASATKGHLDYVNQLVNGQSTAVNDAEARAAERFRKNKSYELSTGFAEALIVGFEKGSKEGVKSLRSMLEKELSKKLVLNLSAQIDQIFGNLLLGMTGNGGGMPGQGSGVMGIASNLMTGASAYQNLTSGTGIMGQIGSALGLGAPVSAVGVQASGAITYPVISSSVTGMPLAPLGSVQPALGATPYSMGTFGTAASGIGGGLAAYQVGKQSGPLAGMTAGAGSVALSGAAYGGIAGGSMAAAGTGATAALGAIPGWGWALMSAASIIGSMDDSGTPHMGGVAKYSAGSGLKTGVDGRGEFGTTFGGVDPGKGGMELAVGMAMGLTTLLDTAAKAFGKKAGYEVVTAFADDTSGDGAWGALRVNLGGQSVLNWDDTRDTRFAPKEFGDGEEGMKQYQDAVAKDMRSYLTSQAPEWAKLVFDGLGDTPTIDQLSQAVTSIGNLSNVLAAMGENVLPALGGATEATITAMVKAAGGADALTASMVSYYDATATDLDRQQFAFTSLSKALEPLGVALPTASTGLRDWYDGLVQTASAQDLSVQANADQLASLLALNSAITALTPAWDAALEGIFGSTTLGALANAALRGDEFATAVINAAGGLEAFGQTLTGYYENFYSDGERFAMTTAQVAKEFANIGETMPTTLAGFRSLVDAAEAAGDGTKLANLLKLEGAVYAALSGDKVAELRQRAAELEVERLRLLGDEEGALAAERAIATEGLSAAAVAEYDRNIALAKSNKALGEHKSLQVQVWTALKKTDQVRASERQGLEQTSYAMFDLVTALDSVAAAANSVSDIEDSLASARESAARTTDDLRKSLGQYIKELSQGRAGTASPTAALSAARLNYLDDLRKAKAGDVDAAKNITQSANAYLEAQKAVTASSGTTQAVIDQVLSELGALQLNPNLGSDQASAEGGVIAKLLAKLDTAIAQLAESLHKTISVDLVNKLGEIDANKDGGVTLDELKEAYKGLASESTLERVFKLLDLDGDGVISNLEAIKGSTGAMAAATAAAVRSAGVAVPVGATTSEAISALTQAGTIAQKASVYAQLIATGLSDAEVRDMVTKAVGVQAESDWQALRNAAAATAPTVTPPPPVVTPPPPTVTPPPPTVTPPPPTAPVTTTPTQPAAPRWDGTFPASWGDYTPTQKVSFFNENAIGPSILDSYGVPQSDIDFMRSHLGYAFASGGVFTNGVVSRPTRFDIGLMGEAGPEAIMPLANVNGSLGVRYVGPDPSAQSADVVAALEAVLQAIRDLQEQQARETNAIVSNDAAAQRRAAEFVASRVTDAVSKTGWDSRNKPVVQ